VASPAIFEIQLIAESAFPVMASHAAQGATRREVLGGARETHLLRLRKPCREVMTVGAAQALSRAVFGVAETGAKSAANC
jgi:hypothetical protein